MIGRFGQCPQEFPELATDIDKDTVGLQGMDICNGPLPTGMAQNLVGIVIVLKGGEVRGDIHCNIAVVEAEVAVATDHEPAVVVGEFDGDLFFAEQAAVHDGWSVEVVVDDAAHDHEKATGTIERFLLRREPTS